MKFIGNEVAICKFEYHMSPVQLLIVFDQILKQTTCDTSVQTIPQSCLKTILNDFYLFFAISVQLYPYLPRLIYGGLLSVDLLIRPEDEMAKKTYVLTVA